MDKRQGMTIVSKDSQALLNILLGFAAFTSMFSMRACDSLVATFAGEFNISMGVAARSVFGFAFAYGIMQLFYGPIGDRYGKLRVLNCALAFCALFNAAVLTASTFDVIVVCRILAGAAGAGIIPLIMAWIGDTVPYSERQVTFTRLLFATISGTIAGQWGSGLLAQYMGWHAVFTAVSGLFASIAIALYVIAHRAGQHIVSEERTQANYLSFGARLAFLLQSKWSRQVLITAAIEGAFALGVFSMVPSYLQRRFHISPPAAGAILALYGAGGIVFAILGKRLLQRIGEPGLIWWGALSLGVSLGLLAFGDAWYWSIPACVLGGFGFYMLHSTLQTNATQMAPAIRGTAVSAFVACLFLGQSLGVVAMSLVVDSSAPILVYLIGTIVFPILGYWFCQRTKRRVAEASTGPRI
jgi:predicted MFS family arabinose efflux permease